MKNKKAVSDKKGFKKNIDYWMNTKNWWGPLLFILIISLAGVGMIGFQTYNDAPPMTGFQNQDGTLLISKTDIEKGQIVFHKYALMEYGAFFGDGAQRGPDFTAEALHQITIHVNDYYQKQYLVENGRPAYLDEQKVIAERVKRELKKNSYDSTEDIVVLSDAYVYALEKVRNYYLNVFLDTSSESSFPLKNYITDKEELLHLSNFFFYLQKPK